MEVRAHSNQITNIPIQPNTPTASVGTQAATPMTATLAPPWTADNALVDNSAHVVLLTENCKPRHEHPLALWESEVSWLVAASRDRRLDLELAAALYVARNECSNRILSLSEREV
jgi:hypothetical protein